MWSKIEPNIKNRTLPKLALTSLLTLSLIASSTVMVSASNSAKPGDVLFPVDTAIEKIQVILASKQKKDELKIKFAEERLEEVKTSLATSSEGIVKKINHKKIKNDELALETALKHLEIVKTQLIAKENINAATTVDAIISKLTEIAQNHVTDLDDLETKIKNGDHQLKVEIKTSGEKIKMRFKLAEHKKDKIDDEKNDKDEEEDDEEDDEDKDKDED